MPSSGYGMVSLIPCGTDEEKATHHLKVTCITLCAKRAMEHGLFIEWLMSFLPAFEATKDPVIAANAGIVEWDL